MKKLKSIICMLMLIAGSLCLWACGKDNDSNKTLQSVTTNLQEFYAKTDTIEWDKIKVTLNYSDKSKVEYDATKGEFDLEDVSKAKESTKWVLNTDGLKAQTAGNMEEKKYNLVLTIVGQKDTYSIRVIVGVDESAVYSLKNFELPERIKAFQDNTKVFDDGTNKNGFKTVKNAKYYVGDDNGFDVTPNYTLIPNDSTTTDSEFKISLDVAVSLKGGEVVGDEYYAYDDNGSVKFTELAVGKEFTIAVKPTFFTLDKDGYDIEEVKFDVTVADGYNIYTAKDLAMLCVPADENKLDASKTNNVSQFARIYSTTNIFYNTAQSKYETKKYWDIWKAYLQENNMQAQYIKGAFIQNNIEITKDDLPSDFFITSQECSGNTYAPGKMRDDMIIYSHYMFDDFTFQGNYFTINTENLPVNGEISSSSVKYLKGVDDNPGEFGHSKLFNFLGQKVAKGELKESNEKKVTVSNINAIGNTQGSIVASKDGSSRDFSATGGIIMFMNSSCAADVENINIKSAMIGWYVEHTDKADNQLSTKTSKAQPTKMNNLNISNCFNAGLFLYGAQGGVDITNSSLSNFGGPAIFAVSLHQNDASKKVTQYEERGSYVTYDDTVTINNYIGGNEAWFSVYEAGNALVAMFKAYNESFKKCGKNAVQSVGDADKFNLKVLVMDEGYVTAETKYLHGKVNGYNYEINDETNQVASYLENYVVNKGASFMWTNANDLKWIYPQTEGNKVTSATVFELGGQTPATKIDGDELNLVIAFNSAAFAMIVDLEDYVTA